MNAKVVTEKIKEQVSKPDHPFWRNLANFCVIVVAPVGAVVIEVFVPEPYRQVAQITLASLTGFLKAGSKLTEKK